MTTTRAVLSPIPGTDLRPGDLVIENPTGTYLSRLALLATVTWEETGIRLLTQEEESIVRAHSSHLAAPALARVA